MTPLLYVLTGFVLCLLFGRYLRMAVSLLALVLSIVGAALITIWLIPEMADLNWRSAGASAALAFILVVIAGSFWFFALGWRARVAATEQDDISRAKQKAQKDRQIA